VTQIPETLKPDTGTNEAAPAAVNADTRLTAEALNRFVYLVGPPRGGTTVISRSFYLSERVFSFPHMTRFTSRVWRYRNKLDARLLKRIFGLPNFYQERDNLKSLNDTARKQVRRRIQSALAEKHLGRMYQLYPLVYALDPNCAKDPARALCWSDKSNDVYGLSAIPRYLPEAKFIFMARDPRATIASMQRQTLITQDSAERPAAKLKALVESCFYWRHMMQSCLRLWQRYPRRTRFIFYEDFVREPIEAINRLHDFAVGERVPAATLGAGLTKFQHKKKHDPDAIGCGIDTRPLERWQRMLRPKEIELVMALTGHTGRKLGYPVGPTNRTFAILRTFAGLEGWRERSLAATKFAYLEFMERLTPTLPRQERVCGERNGGGRYRTRQASSMERANDG
jgi:hypothetical protein